MEHHQLVPADLHAAPRPGEREIYRRAACTGHSERPAAPKEREDA